MIYLLGGPPRVGKSTISGAFPKKHGISVVSTDSLGYVLENILDPEAEPDLFVFTRFLEMPTADRMKMMVGNTPELMEYMIKESRVVWKAVMPFIRKENEEGRDALIEGVAVLPESVSRIENMDYRVVFVGNRGNEHKDDIKRSAKENEFDWMRDAGDEYMDAFAAFVGRMSGYIEKEAHRYGFQYVEMAQRPFQEISVVIEELFGLKAR